MALKRDDILVIDGQRDELPSPSTKIVAFVPITIALIGVAAILLGGMQASPVSTAERQAIDPITTSSIGK